MSIAMHLELLPAVAGRLALLYLSSGALRGALSGPGRQGQLLGRFVGVPWAMQLRILMNINVV